MYRVNIMKLILQDNMRILLAEAPLQIERIFILLIGAVMPGMLVKCMEQIFPLSPLN
jgi:hypothetical protein